ncbi:MAG: tyrosine-type recombinase/integrase [Ruminococcus sp.]|nr:tyrosine-type recombinase/integrase [Ruminococcus sp.]
MTICMFMVFDRDGECIAEYDKTHLFNQTPSVDVPMLNPHELRHTRASIWVNDGKNLFAISDQMGWSDLDMLRKRYAHVDISQLRKQLDL